MEALHAIPSSPSPMTCFKGDEQEDKKESLGRGYSFNGSTARIPVAPHILYQSCRKGFRNNKNEGDALPDHLSSQDTLLENANPIPPSSLFHVASSADRNVEILSEEEKYSTNKETKMEKQKSGPSGSNGLVDIGDGLSKPINKCRPEISLPELNFDGNISGSRVSEITDKTSDLKTISTNTATGSALEDIASSSPQKFNTDDHKLHYGNGVHPIPVRYSISNGEAQKMQCRLINHPDDPHETSVELNLTHYPLMKSKDPCFSEMNDSLVLDSISLASNSDEGSTTKHDLDLGISESSSHSTKAETSNHSDIITAAEESHNCVGRMNYINGDRNSHNTETGDRNFRKVRKKRNTYNIHNLGTLDSCGKENTLSIWRKVRKNDSDECKYNSRSVNTAGSDSSDMLTEALGEERHCQSAHIFAKSEEEKQTKPKAFRKPKREKRPCEKQKNDSCFRHGLSSVITSSNGCLKNDVDQNVVFDSEAQSDKPNDLDTYSHSHTRTGHYRTRFRDKNVKSEAQADRPNVGSAKNIKGVAHGEWGKKDAGSGAIPQTWMSIGSKGCRIPRLIPDRSPSRMFNEPDADFWIPEKIVLDHLVSFGAPNSPERIKVMNAGQRSENFKTSSSQGEPLVQKLTDESHLTDESRDNNAAQSCIKHETDSENASLIEKVSCNILGAVNDVHRAQLASEMIEKRTGLPVAEFERFLFSASPAIYRGDYVRRCQACMHHQAIDESLCSHDIPDISLGSLWKWYEKPGSYGLEVKAEDCNNPKRLGVDQFAFRAYFVPFLSAVQLFKYSKGHCSSMIMAKKEHDKSKAAANSSNIGLLPIFSILFPRAKSSSSAPANHISDSGISSVSTEERASDLSCSDDPELLFEYFDSEQPQRRRPLFEMIKELVEGDGPSKFSGYGDPAILDTVGLRELHPNSWYSVAWYPIYRIPDDGFRAAFLTYHSLGHFIQRGHTSVSSFADSSCIVSPVVGLESYNAQSECWFRPRHLSTCKPKQLMNKDPSGVLEQRLRTLGHTASVMARAVVKKGNETHVNKQPDYEFFVSRRVK